MSEPVRPPYYPAGSQRPSAEPLVSAASNALGLPPTPLLEARERAVKVLSDAYAYDVISEEEFERRLDRLHALDSSAAIETLLSDLRPPSPAGYQSAMPGHALAADAPGRLRATLTSTRRDGYWTVPQRLEVRAFMSDVNIDLRLATIPYGCVIDVRSMMSSVTITLPPGLAVTLEVDGVLSSVENGTTDVMQAAPAATVRVTGRTVMSNVEVRARAIR